MSSTRGRTSVLYVEGRRDLFITRSNRLNHLFTSKKDIRLLAKDLCTYDLLERTENTGRRSDEFHNFLTSFF